MIKETLILEVLDTAYHRNGVGGRGFHVVDLIHRGDDDALVDLRAIYIPRDDDETLVNFEECYVTNLSGGDVDDKYRGDRFAPEVHRAIFGHAR